MARRVFGCCAALLGLVGPAAAVVGGAPAPEAATGAVMVLSSKGGVCTGVVVAPDAILTAGHCLAPGLAHRVHYKGADGTPVLAEPAAQAVHPGYDAGAITGRRRSVDLALVRLAAPLPAPFAALPLSDAMPRAGEAVTVAGYGVGTPGDPRSSGTYRQARVPVVEPYGPSRLLVWVKGTKTGACQGDSGGPVTDAAGVVAVAAWVGGACGGLSQGVLVGPQRAWIDATLAGWGLAARWVEP
ncbi:trypsin-like serine protease [Methylobacterium gossipiicola]|uniref:Trypsin n=1 Tax=Methylobacterium gossipiicola TaxID=582675 RepID=A0A1I2RQB0_9HYPH|nr:trypsin-like serine protease [Methylobacterium gossipiicola]SFG42895.1 Trypsin [Methylobacterium gossipiicola]